LCGQAGSESRAHRSQRMGELGTDPRALVRGAEVPLRCPEEALLRFEVPVRGTEALLRFGVPVRGPEALLRFGAPEELPVENSALLLFSILGCGEEDEEVVGSRLTLGPVRWRCARFCSPGPAGKGGRWCDAGALLLTV